MKNNLYFTDFKKINDPQIMEIYDRITHNVSDQIKTEDSANIETERCNAVHEKVHNLRDLLRQLQSGTLPGYLSK